VGANAVVILVSVSPFQIWGKREAKIEKSELKILGRDPGLYAGIALIAGPEVARSGPRVAPLESPRKTTG
jgi:hypothetical protein